MFVSREYVDLYEIHCVLDDAVSIPSARDNSFVVLSRVPLSGGSHFYSFYDKGSFMTKAPDTNLPVVRLYDDKRQDNPYWMQMWKDGRTKGFHQTLVNPLLIQYWQSQNLKKNSRILVPLCGKSLDMLWLVAQGYRVVGVELSPIAVKSFFSENNLKAKKKRIGNFTCWKSGAIDIWCGDFFSMQKTQLGRIDCVLDRASLTALPAQVRSQYIHHLNSLIDSDVDIFLVTVEDVTQACGFNETHIDSEISELYAQDFNVTLLHAQRTYTEKAEDSKEVIYIDNKVYQISQKSAQVPIL